jgi:predicted nucleotidyltransferase
MGTSVIVGEPRTAPGAGGGRPLADALFTKTQQRVLALLFGQPGRTFFIRELIERTGSGSGAVQRELARLVESGVVRLTIAGKQKRYEANRTSPIFDELRGIVTKTVGLADPIRAALRPLTRRIVLSLIYGSVAKGEARAESDVDLLVVAHDLPLEELFRRLAPAEKALGRKIHPTLYTPEEFEKRRRTGNAFLQKVLAGKHVVLMEPTHGAREAR